MLKYSNLLLLSHYVSFKAMNRVFFSNNKVDIQVLEQKAFLAKVIMKEIATNRTFDEIKQYSLTERIKKKIQEQSKKEQVRDTVREQMTRFFTTGVIANTKIFNQKRHQRQIFGFQEKKEMMSSNQDGAISLDQQNQMKKIRFFPTTLISRQVFHELLYQSNPFYLMTGHYGISKSIAVHLFWHLSNIVSQYECRQDKGTPKLPRIFVRVPKILYWNIKVEEDKEEVREKILSQCSQIGEDLVDSQFLKPSSKSLRKFYTKKGIPLIQFVDQFSLYVKYYRDNEKNKPENIQQILEKKKKNKKLDKEEKKQLAKYEESKQQSIQFEKNIKKCFEMLRFKNFDRTFYLSSVDIEKQLLRELRLTDDPKHIGVEHHRFRYEEFLSNKSCLYELIDYFMFEVKEKIQTPLLHSDKYNNQAFLKSIRDSLFEKFQSPVYKIHLTPFSISTCIRIQVQKASPNISGLTEINLEEEKQEVFLEKVLDQLGLLFEKCIKSARVQFEQRINDFINKAHKTEKLAVLSALFLENLKMNNNQNSQGSYDKKKQGGQNDYANTPTHKLQIDVNKLLNPSKKNEMASVKNPDQNKSESDYGYTPKLLQSFISKALFFYKGEGKLCSYFSYSDIESLLKLVREDVIWFMESYSEKIIAELGMNERSKGKKFENFFIETVSCGGFNLQFPLVNAHFNEIPNKKLWFASIPQDKSKIQKWKFLEGLKKSLQYMDTNQIETTVLVPILEKVIKQKEENFLNGNEEIGLSHIDIKSPSIDLIIPQVPLKNKRKRGDFIRLYAFDLTTWNTPEKIKNKISNFLNNFLQFNDNNQMIINLNGVDHPVQIYYYVISPVKTLKSQDKKNYLQEIKAQFESQFEFEKSEQEHKDVLMVNQMIKNGKKIKTSLVEIGNLPMDKASMKIGKVTKNAEIKHLWIFDKLMKEINSHTQKNQPSSTKH